MKRNRISLPNGCSMSTPTVNPENWKTCNKLAIKKDWYICYYFYDNEFPKPKQIIVKGMNAYKNVEDRRNATKFLLENELHSLKDLGYNPYTKKYFIPQQVIRGELHRDLNFIEALKIAYPKLTVSDGVKKELRRIIAKISKSAAEQRIDFPIGDIHSGYVRDLLDYLNLTPNEYNKFLTHLSIVLSDLVEKRIVFHNPIRDIKKKKTVKKIRETLEVVELKKIFKILKSDNYTFYRYGMIFFHSGARSAELFRVQKKDVNLTKQEYKVTILKGSVSKEVIKVILPNVLSFWTEIVQECTNDNDYLFARDLKPALIPIRAYQITKRWKRLVKDKLDVTADFYSLKHLFLDELDRASQASLNLSKGMASHQTNVTETVYLVGRQNRKNEALKNIVINIMDAV